MNGDDGFSTPNLTEQFLAAKTDYLSDPFLFYFHEYIKAQVEIKRLKLALLVRGDIPRTPWYLLYRRLIQHLKEIHAPIVRSSIQRTEDESDYLT